MKKFLALFLCALLLTGCSANTKTPVEATTVSFEVYYGDENAEKLLSKTVQTNVISETSVLFTLIGAGVLPEETSVNSLVVKEGQLTLDLNEAFQDHLLSMGTAGERILIGSVVNTFLSAYGADSVLITVNGSTLESGHAVYDTPLGFVE